MNQAIEIKKVSANVISFGNDLVETSKTIQERQQDYERIIHQLSGEVVNIKDFDEIIQKDYSLVHKCYYLNLPDYSFEEKLSEEGNSVSIVGNRTSRRNSTAFFNLYVIFYIFIFIDFLLGNDY